MSGNSDTGRKAVEKGARKNPVAVIVIALVVLLALYTGVVGGVDRLPSWLRPIATALVGNGGGNAEPARQEETPSHTKDEGTPAALPAPTREISAPPSAPVKQEQAAPRQVKKEETRPIPAGSYHAKGRVIKLLADDDDGIRHQKFLVRLADGSTLLVVHNIDLAPRLDDLAPGDDVEVCGEFVENDKGGLVHWTHHVPPRSRHSAGWIKHLGKIYE